MRKRLIIIFTIIFVIVYYIGTLNFVIIKPSPLIYFATAFDNEGEEWYCKKYNLKAKVLEQNSMKFMMVENLENGDKYCFDQLGYNFVCIRTYSKEFDSSKEILSTGVRYKKRWGKICGFTIYNVDYNGEFSESDNVIIFKKLKNNKI